MRKCKVCSETHNIIAKELLLSDFGKCVLVRPWQFRQTQTISFNDKDIYIYIYQVALKNNKLHFGFHESKLYIYNYLFIYLLILSMPRGLPVNVTSERFKP